MVDDSLGIRVRSGPAAGDDIDVQPELVIGRLAESEQGKLGDDPELSRRHARFSRTVDGKLRVEDLGSTNGTLLNGRRIDALEELNPGDIIRAGSSELEVYTVAAPAFGDAVQATAIGGQAPPPAALRVTGGPAAGQVIELRDDLLLGREADADGRLGNDSELSRRHAQIIRDVRGQVEIEDLGSTNGTFVNGQLISGACALKVGDTLRVGTSSLELQGPAGERFQPTVTVARPTPPPEEVHAGPTNSIEVEGLVREFKDGPRAVDGINLWIHPGEIFGFLGPNGAGKSTTVHMLTTLLPPSGGEARVAGYDIVKDAALVRASIGVALQEAALDASLTAWEHMSLQTALQGVPKSERRKRAESLLERVGLTEFADRRVGGYSGGMKRRLDLALALVHEPRVIFLDEPTTGLDPKSRNDLWAEVGRLAKEDGVTVFLTTQYLEEADVLADRVGIIDRGQIVAEGTPAELKADLGRATVEVVPDADESRGAVAGVLERFGELADGGHRGVAVQLSGAGDLADIVRALDAEGLRIANLALHEPTLDDVFLAKTGRSLEEEVQASETGYEGRSGVSQLSIPGQPVPQQLQ